MEGRGVLHAPTGLPAWGTPSLPSGPCATNPGASAKHTTEPSPCVCAPSHGNVAPHRVPVPRGRMPIRGRARLPSARRVPWESAVAVLWKAACSCELRSLSCARCSGGGWNPRETTPPSADRRLARTEPPSSSSRPPIRVPLVSARDAVPGAGVWPRGCGRVRPLPPPPNPVLRSAAGL